MEFGEIEKHFFEELKDFESKTPDEKKEKLIGIRDFLIKSL